MTVLFLALLYVVSWFIYSYDLHHGSSFLLGLFVIVVSIKEWILYKRRKPAPRPGYADYLRYAAYAFVLLYLSYWGPMIASVGR